MSPKEKLEILHELSFGQRVAEDDPKLEAYFVETPLWRNILRGEIDIVYGVKGSGKSAIFNLLTSGKYVESPISVIAAENPRGTPIFNGIKTEPPTGESEFVYLWKLYVLSLVVNQHPRIVEELGNRAPDTLTKLEEVGVIGSDKSEVLRNALKYVRNIKLAQIEVGLQVPEGESPFINIERTLSVVDNILQESEEVFWIAFDRLDSVFDDNFLLEENALRALFKTYLDLLRLRNIRLKIFLRTDIWVRLTNRGFREASHITRAGTIEWSENNILNLIIKRLLNNPLLLSKYGIDPPAVLGSYVAQQELFYRLYPTQVDPGTRRPTTLKWIASRVADGSRQAAPREIIHLLTQTRDEQITSLEVGELPPEKENLFNSSSLKRALPIVSKIRLEQTLFAEYPEIKERILELESEKAQQSTSTLASIWKVSEEEASQFAGKLVEVGFFEVRGEKGNPEYWVPFIYRPRLSLVQGKAEEDES